MTVKGCHFIHSKRVSMFSQNMPSEKKTNEWEPLYETKLINESFISLCKVIEFSCLKKLLSSHQSHFIFITVNVKATHKQKGEKCKIL